VPAKHHRTVDRVMTILELVARSPAGLTLTELAEELSAAKSSIQELTNGLVATGYLVEQKKRYLLGPGPFLLTLAARRAPTTLINHADLAGLQSRVGVTALVAIQVGDTFVYVDEVGENPRIDFYARSRRRRPLLGTAAGKTILAHVSAHERDELLTAFHQSDPDAVDRFLRELPEIQRTGLAFSRGGSIPGVHAVGAPLHDHRDQFVAAVVLAAETGGDLERLGAELLAAIQGWRAR
jgi:DNA-binding IclR family transcriptional regulator